MCGRGPVLVLTLAAASCAAGRHHHVDAARFVELAARTPTSLHGQHFVGADHRRAYLSVWNGLPSSLGGGHHVYSTPLANLPDDVRATIAAGRDPWAPPAPAGMRAPLRRDAGR